MEVVDCSFALYIGGFQAVISGRGADVISVSSTRIQVIFRDLIHKQRNTVYGGFSLLPDIWYSALL